MKTKTIIFLLIGLSLVFSACFSTWSGDEGTLTVSVGGGSVQSRSALPWNGNLDTDDLLHIITITGRGQKQEARFIGSGTASFFVAIGRWNVAVKAYDISEFTDKQQLLDITYPPPPQTCSRGFC